MPKDIKYLDSVFVKEELPPEKLNETKRRFSISRSGRFKSKNKQREAIDANLFDKPNMDQNQSHHNNGAGTFTYSTTHNKEHATQNHHHSKEMIASG